MDFAFGVDISSGDHKIVRVVLYADWEKDNYFWNHNFWTSEVKVFSFGSNSWTRVPDLPFNDLKLCTPSVHLNGAVHWLVCDRDYYSSESLRFVIAFDLASYEFHTLPVPNNILEPGRSGTMMSSCLIVLDGCLCLCVSDRAKATQEVWMMKEYGVHESWCRLFIFENCELPCRPLVLSKTNGAKVLMEQGSKRLFWYDYISGGIEGVEISGMPFAFNTTVCIGSLLLLDGDPIQAAQL